MYPPGGQSGPAGPQQPQYPPQYQQPQYPPQYQQPQYPPQQPQYQPQQPPQQYALPTRPGSGVGRLVIEAKCSPLVWMQRLLGKPKIMINGGSVPAHWGVNNYDLPDGEHTVQATTDFVFRYVATAYTTVPVQAGRQTLLYYKAPVFVRRAGALDQNPKGYPGMGILITGYVSAVVVIVALVGYFLFLSSSG
ncbi:MAG TPA: hypothetical protein VF053_14160 [Streptosporangiales bacterium]